jgi:hypothetical protein
VVLYRRHRPLGQGRFTDGAWLAGLAPVRDPAQVAAVGAREQPGVPLADTLARALAGQQLLVVLDNCEHVTGAAAQLCAGLLAACDHVRVLAIGREPLAWAMEHDTALALRLASALGSWWSLRGRLAGQYRLLCQAASGTEAGSGGWCAGQLWLGQAARDSADPAAALGHFTAVRVLRVGRAVKEHHQRGIVGVHLLASVL